jgi:hypothetical protein
MKKDSHHPIMALYLKGYITRLRGYYANYRKVPGYQQGRTPSWFYVLEPGDLDFDQLRHYYPLKQTHWGREFPTSWRLLDSDIEEASRDLLRTSR